MKNKGLLIFLISSLLIIYFGKIDISKAPFCDIPDITSYRMMAEAAPGFDETVSRNFGYRLLSPYVVGLLPFDIDTGFYIVSIILSLIIPFVFMKFLKEYGLGDHTVFYITILFLLNKYTFGFPVWDPYDIHDLLTHIFILLFFIAMKKNNFILMGLYLLIGVINRETLLFIIPSALIYYIFVVKNIRSASNLFLALLPALVLLIIIRSTIITESASGKGVIYSLSKLRFDESNKMFNPITYYRIINTFIPLSFIPFIYFDQTKRFFKKNIHLLIFIFVYYGSCFLAGDTERLIAPTFPVFYLLLGLIFEKINFISLKEKITVLFITAFALPHHIYFRFTLPSRNFKVVLSLITLLAVTGFFIYKKYSRKNEILNNNTDI